MRCCIVPFAARKHAQLDILYQRSWGSQLTPHQWRNPLHRRTTLHLVDGPIGGGALPEVQSRAAKALAREPLPKAEGLRRLRQSLEGVQQVGQADLGGASTGGEAQEEGGEEAESAWLKAW